LLLEAHPERRWGTPRPALAPVLLGAAVNVWLNDGGAPGALGDGLLIRTGRRHIRVTFKPGPGAT
jgi:hypothetical protein